MVKFNVNEKYCFDLSKKIEFGNIQKESLYEIFRDGRITGLLAEYFIESEFSNMNRVRNNNSYLDLIDDKGKKFEVYFTVTASGNANIFFTLYCGTKY